MSLPFSRSFTEGRRDMGGRKLAMDILPEDKMAFRLMLETSQGHGMTSIREWLQNRLGSLEFVQSVSKTQEDKRQTAVHSGVITPQSIPEFVIPIRGSDELRLCHSLNDMKLEDNNSIQNSIDTKNHLCPQQMQNATSEENIWVGKNILSADDKDESKSRYRKNGTVRRLLPLESISNEESGSESGTNDDPKSAAAVSLPHLRTCTSFGFTTLTESPHTRRKESLLFGSASMDDVKKLVCNRAKFSSGEEQGPYSTLPGITKLQLTDALSVPTMLSTSTCSSLQSDHSVSPNDSPLFTYTSRLSERRKYKRRRSSAQTPPRLDSDCSVSSGDISATAILDKQQANILAPLGEVKLSLLYNRQDSTMRLVIIKAENLAKDVEKSLRLRICNQQSTRKYETLGEVMLPLATLGLEHGDEVRMWRDIETKSTNQELGSLKISAKFEPKKDSLNITVLEANGLSRRALTGPPDSYVRVIVKQDGKPAIKKQTKIRKNTVQPIFKETLSFTVSPHIETLRYTTVRILILSKERLRNDVTLGEAILGYGSNTDDGLIHWSQVVNNVNTEVERCHKLQHEH